MSKSTAETMPPPVPSLTGLRGLAVWCIIWAHTLGAFTTAERSPLLYDTTRVGLFGMTLFFVLSGFVIHYNYGAAIAERKNRAIWSFFVARVARLFPLYLLVLAQASRAPLPFQSSVFGEVWPYFLTLSQIWLPLHYDDRLLYMLFVPAAWSISAEFFLYLLYVPMAGLLWRLGLKPTLVIAAITLVAFTALRLGHSFGLWRGLVNDYWAFYLSPYCRFPEFLLGAIVAQATRLHVHRLAAVAGTFPRWRGVLLGGAAIWTACVYFGAQHPEFGPVLDHFQLSWGFAPGIAALMYVCAVDPGRLSDMFANTVALLLGDVSYSTYLLNGYVFWPFMKWQQQIFGTIGTVPAILAMWALILIVSIVSYRLYELPAKKIVRRLLDPPRLKPALSRSP
jgi:peptidoglycan/LPS O-acetylase OafA/YrhL